MLPGAIILFYFLSLRDLLGSYIKQVEKDSLLLLPICFMSSSFAMGTMQEWWKWIISHSFAQFWLSLLLLWIKSVTVTAPCQVSKAVFIWDSLTFFTTRGPSKTWNVLFIFSSSASGFKEMVFRFYCYKLSKQRLQNFILEFSEKGKWESCYYLKSRRFLGFVYIKWSHLILGLYPIIFISYCLHHATSWKEH